MISYPLKRVNRVRLARAFANVPKVDIGIDCVVEDQMGKAFVDSVENPQLYMVEMDGFFCYYAGDLASDAGRDFVSKTPRGRMLMAGPEGWLDVVQSVLTEGLMVISRFMYSSVSLSIDQLRQMAAKNPNTPNVQRIDAALAGHGLPFMELGAFDSPEDFESRGIGFCLMKDGQSLGVAYSSLVCSDAIEVSIVVDEAHRQKGIATALSCQLLLWCMERQIAPHWDAANEQSCALAEKLGYVSEGKYTAFFLRPT